MTIARFSLCLSVLAVFAASQISAVAAAQDPCSAPFLCVLEESRGSGVDIWDAIATRLSGEAGDARLAVYESPAGIRYASAPQSPVVEPSPETVGAEHRKRMNATVTVLRAIPDDLRSSMAGGGWTNLSAARDRLSELLGPQPSLPIVARVDPSPTVVLSQSAEEGGACIMVSFMTSAPVSVDLVQIDRAGSVTWTRSTANPDIGDGWCALPLMRADAEWVGRACLPPVHAALAASGKTVCLDALHGLTLSEVVTLACDGLGATIRLTEDLASRRLACRGGEVQWSDALEAILLSAWARPFWDSDAKTRVWGIGVDAPSERLSRALEKQAGNSRAPEVSAEVDALLGDPSSAWPALLARLPIRSGLFISRWRGLLSELPPADRTALEAVLDPLIWEQTLENASAGGDPGRLQYRWRDLGGDPTLEFRMAYRFLLVPCGEYSEVDPLTGRRAPCPVPDAVYDELGASRDLPVYSCLSLGATLY